MTDKAETMKLKVKCPYCGYENTITISYKKQDEPIAQSWKFLRIFSKPDIGEAAKWEVHRPCANCGEAFEYHTETKETRR